MNKSSTKTKKFSKKKIALIVVASVLFCLILAISLMFGIGACHKQNSVEAPKSTVTVRKELPTGGADPMKTDGLDTIGYLAYVLDNQPQYHAYASNSTKSSGYEQVTRTWKDYMSAAKSGFTDNVMVCSDLSYSSLVKSASQSCFVGEHAYMRGGNKPSKTSVPEDIAWSDGLPTHYTHEKYLETYGEFSTELSVYILNKFTVDSWDGVVDNGDGTFSQKFYLNSKAAYWYQNGMKTRGGLKGYPAFERIEITFTFDAKFQVLGSYCEESVKIAPAALGGVPLPSSSKTTTEYDYSAENFDSVHYGYFENYYKDNLDAALDPDDIVKEPELLDVLGNAFSEVVNAEGNGQQFALGLDIGGTDYTGKIYLKLTDMSNVLSSLDARVALEKKDTGRQDFYAEMKNGAINAYYGEDFAMTANLSEVATSIGKITSWVGGLNLKGNAAAPVSYVLADDEAQSSGLDLSSLLNELKFTLTKTSATIAINSEDLLGLGIGVDAKLEFTRTKDEEGYDNFSLVSVNLNKLSFGGEDISLIGEILPDDSPVISRNAVETPANLADYIDGIYDVLTSNTVKVTLSLGDKLIDGLSLEAQAYVKIGSGIATRVDIDAAYKGITLSLSAYYLYDGGYGKIYLNVTEVNGQAIDAKVYCDIKDAVETVTDIINYFKGETGGEPDVGGGSAEEAGNGLANIINKVLALNFEKIICKVTGTASKISVAVDVDEILSGLDVNVGITFGLLDLALNNDGGEVSLDASLPELALAIGVSGSDVSLATVADPENYVDAVAYLESVYALLKSNTLKVTLALDGTFIEGLSLEATAFVKIKDEIATRVDISGSYRDITLKLSAYYIYDGGYGRIYLNVTELGGQQVNAKVYCDIADAATAVKQIIALFDKPEEAVALSEEQTDVLGTVIGIVLGLDFNEVLKVDSSSLEINIGVDEILSALGVNIGIEFGTLNLTYDRETSSLAGKLPALGLEAGVTGSDSEVKAPEDTHNYVDIVTYLDSVYALLGSNTLEVTLSLDGTFIDGLSLEATAFVNVKDEIATRVDVEGAYKDITLKLSAYYIYDGGYGRIYLNITELGGQEINAKVYCDIKDAVTAVTDLINLFKSPSEISALADSEEADTLGAVLGVILSLDFNEILRADGSAIEINADVDSILSALGVDIGIEFGTVTLRYDRETSSLAGKLPALGLEAEVKGSESEISAPEDTSNYVDIVAFVESVTELIGGGKYSVSLKIDGTQQPEQLKGITAEVLAEAEFTDANNLAVNLDITAGYILSGNNLTVDLSAYYEIDIKSGNYGRVYLNVTGLCGQEVNAKVYCDIKDAVTAVTELINLFRKPAATPVALAEASGTQEADTLGKVIGVILSLDFNSLINADNESVCLNVNVDGLLGGLGVDLGVDWLEFGELSLVLNVSDGAAELSGALKQLGLTLGLSAGNGATAPTDRENYVDVVSYIQNLTALVKGGKFSVYVKLDGTTQAIAELNGATAELNATVEFIGADKKTVAVNLDDVKVTYKDITVVFDAYYEINITSAGKTNYGKVYINVKEVGEQKELAAKVYADIAQAVDAVTDIIELFKKPSTQPASYAAGDSTLDKVLGIVFGLDFNALLNADNSGFTLTVNADDILAEFVEMPFELGTVTLDYSKADNAFTGKIEKLGLTLGLSASEKGAVEPTDKDNYVDVVSYIQNITGLLKGGKFSVYAKLDGTTQAIAELNGATAELNATVEFIGDDKKTVAVNLDNVKVTYKDITVVFDAYYEINITSAGKTNYGKVYINVKEVGEQKELAAKVYADIAQAVDAVTDIIELFKKPSTQPASYAAGDSTLDKVLGIVFGLDFNALLNADNNGLTLTVNADDILAEFVEMPFELGTVTLDYSKANNAFTGKIEKLGLTLGLSASEKGAVEPDDKDNYVNVNAYLDGVYALITSGRYSVNIAINGDGEKVIDKLNGIAASANAVVEFKGEDKTTLAVNLTDVTASYRYAAGKVFSLLLDAYYEINITSAGKTNYGDVYLNIREFNGQSVGLKLSCNIYDAVESVNNLLALFSAPEKTPETQAPASSETSGTAGTDMLGKVIGIILGLDFNSVISADNEAITLRVNADDLLEDLGVDLGIGWLEFGQLELSLINGEAGAELTGSLEKLGLSLGIAASKVGAELADADSYVDIVSYITDVTALIASGNYHAEITLDGTKENDTVINTFLKGVYANVVADVEFKGENKDVLAVNLTNLKVSYSGYSVTLNAYYEMNFAADTYGTVYLNLTEINGQAFDAKVYCDMDGAAEAVRRIIALVTPEENDGENEAQPALLADSAPVVSANITVEKVIETLLKLDYTNLIKADNSSLSLSFNADTVLKGIGVDINIENLGLGDVNLSYTKSVQTEDGTVPAAFTGDMEKFGLTVLACGSQRQLNVPFDAANYLDVNTLLGLVEKAVKEVNKIIEAEDIAFTVNAVTGADGSSVGITGEGEVIWSNNTVAVGVSLNISSGETEFALNFVYDGGADNDSPLVQLTLDGYGFDKVGLKVYNGEISDLKAAIDRIIALFSKQPTAPEEVPAEGEDKGAEEVQPLAEVGGIDIAAILESSNLKNALGKVLSFIGNLTVKLEEVGAEGVRELVISYLDKGAITLGTDGNLSLEISAGTNTDVKACVEAGNGATVSGIKDGMNAVTGDTPVYTYYNLEGFSKVIYDWIFDAIDNRLSLKELLGSDAYTVEITLDGNESALSALKDIKVNATLTYAEPDAGVKLIGAKFELDIKGTKVRAGVSYYNRAFYITLYEVSGLKLYMQTAVEGMKIRADVDNVYLAVETLVNMLLDENVISAIDKLMNGTKSETPVTPDSDGNAETEQVVALSDESAFALTDILNALLTVDFGSMITADNGTLNVDVDGLLASLGVTGVTVGNVSATLDKDNKSLTANITAADAVNAWLSVAANPAAITSVNIPNAGDYLDISFISDLLSDLNKTLTDNDGKVHELYSFSGKMKVNIFVPEALIKDAVKEEAGRLLGSIVGGVIGNINEDISINVTTLTAGFDGDGDFYFSLMGSLADTTWQTLGGLVNFKLAQASDIAVNYSKGYITLGRDISNSGAQYKVMTLNYFLDNLFSENSSPVQWLLQMNTTVWGIVAGLVPSGTIGSSVSKPDYYSLYGDNTFTTEEKISNFVLSNYLTDLMVSIVNGERYDFNASEKDLETFVGNSYYSFNGDNYYALQINAKKLDSMLDYLYAALYRTEEQGITGIALQTALKISSGSNNVTITVYVNLDNYLEGAGVYSPSTDGTSLAGKQAPNFFKIVDGSVTGGINFDYYKNEVTDTTQFTREFGCYDTKDGYSPLDVLTKYTLTIVGLDGVDEVALKYGSTVDASGFKPIDEKHKLVYTYDKEGNAVVETFEFTGDITIYAQSKEIYKMVCIHLSGGKCVYYPITEENEELPDLTDSGYMFLGWYTNSEFEGEAVTRYSEECGTDIYGKFVQEKYIADNGVIYEFEKNESDLKNSYYTAAGIDYDTAYGLLRVSTREGVTGEIREMELLELENAINGYNVTHIKANAFDVSNTGIYIVNALIPENVTTVGAAAFKDNYAIQKAIFTANKVYLEGTDKNTVFYGCSVADSGKTTVLEVYYNTLDSAMGGDWTYYRDGCYIGRSGGGLVHSNGNWSYDKFTLNCDNGIGFVKSDFGFDDGIYLTGLTAEQIAAKIMLQLNTDMYLSDRMINKYIITVDNGYNNNGKINRINITVKLNENPYYLLTVQTQPNALISGVKEVFMGNTYVQSGTVVIINPADGYLFESILSDDVTVTDNSFTMPKSDVLINAVSVKDTIKQVYINSEVDYIFDGIEYKAGEAACYAPEDLEEGITTLPEISSPESEYLFLGWAFDNSTYYEFTDGVIRYGNYYAVWTKNRNEISSVAPMVSGTNPNAYTANVTVNTDYAHSFSMWYLDEDFVNAADLLTSTVLYSRVEYTVTIQYSLKSKMYIYYGGNDWNADGARLSSAKTSHTEYLYVLEKNLLTVVDKETIQTAYGIKVNGVAVVNDIRVKNMKTALGGVGNTQKLTASCSDISDWEKDKDFAVTKNLTVIFSCSY